MRRVLMIVLIATLAACAGRDGGFAGRHRGKLSGERHKNDLPVSSVTLYAGGAAYIEHKGTIKDDATIELRFKDGQLDGVLKSLIVRDESDPQPSVVVRPRGSSKTKASDAKGPSDDSFAENDEETKSPSAITVLIRGKGERQVTMGYTLDAQPWKTSYRLMFSSKPALQAWAKVVNDTEYDWKDVRLSLLSGRPLVLAEGATLDSAAVSKAAGGAGVTAGESLRRPRPIPSRQALDRDLDPGSERGAIKDPDEGDIGGADISDPRQAFRYEVRRISVPRGASVAVPVLTDGITVERVVVYNEKMLARNPLQGARIRNTTRHYLLQGPLAVLDEGDFAGDAIIENLAPGRQGLVTWGIDLPVLINATRESYVTSIKDAKIDKGLLQATRNHVFAKRYLVENEDQQQRSVIIEHPIRRGWRLLEPAETMQTTESLYRFRLTAPAGKRIAMVVREQTTETEGIELATADAETVRSSARNGELSNEVRDALTRALAIKEKFSEQYRQLQQKQTDFDRNAAEQAKTRDDLKALGEQHASRARLESRIAQLQRDGEELSKSLDQTQKDLEKARKEMEQAVGAISAGK